MKCLLLFAAVVATTTGAKYTGPINQAGVNLIKEFEGFRANFYLDPVGIRTIGYGHACHANSCRVPLRGKYNVPLTRANGEALLKDDLRASYEPCVKNAVTYRNLNANQYSALVSFTFNLGCGNLRSSTLLRKLNAGDARGASNEFARWVYAGGKQLPGLVRRRAAEKSLFCAGGGCGSSPPPSSCRGTTTAGLNIRASPSTSSAVKGSLAKGSTVTITGRASGTIVSGNRYWFKISQGYVSAYYMNIASNNGASYCKKT